MSGRARFTAVSSLAARTNGSAPESSSSTAACLTPSAPRPVSIVRRIESPYIVATLLLSAIDTPPLSRTSTEIQQSERTCSPLRPA